MRKTATTATRIYELERTRQLVKLAIGGMNGLKAPGYSAPAASTGSGPSNTISPIPAAVPKALSAAGTGIYNNGGKQTLQMAGQAGNAIWNNGGQTAWNNVGKPLVNTGMNTLEGISAAGIGAANLGAGLTGNVIAGAGYGLGAATDAAGVTNNAKDWVHDNIFKHTNEAVQRGVMDIGGAAADVATGGNYDYDGTFAAPGEHKGTMVEQQRSGIRDELGRGSDLDNVFQTATGVSNVAADMAAYGGVGSGLNVAAKAVQGSQTAAPVLNAVAKTPVVGKHMAAAGNFMAGQAPAANMFAQNPAQYYRSALGPNPTVAGMTQQFGDDALNIASNINPVDRPDDYRTNQQNSQAGGQFNVQDQGQQPDGAFNAAAAGGLKDASPEVQSQATQAADAVQQNPLAREAVQNPEVAAKVTEEAKPKFDQQAQEEYAAAVPQPTNGNPQDYGKWMADMGTHIEKSWGAMGPMGQLAFGLGVPMALIGMMSGNIGGFLMGALGLGAAGMAGASGGMFGPEAQGWVNNAITSLAGVAGGNVPNADAIRGRLEAAAKQGPEAAQAELEKVRAEVQPYSQFSSDAEKFMADSADKNYMYNQAEQYASNNYSKLVDEKLQNPQTWGQRIGGMLGFTGEAANTPGTQSHYWMGAPEDNIARELAAKGFVKQQSVHIMQKAAKCWAGYERVPGTKAYTEGSCRPAGSKKTKKEVTKGKKHTEKKAAKPYTGQHSATPFDATHAAGLMGMKPDTDSQQVYNRMMHKYQAGGFTPAQFSELRTKYQGLPPAYAPPQPTSPQPSQAQAAQAPTQTPATSVKPPVPPAPVSSQPKPPAPAMSMPRPTMIQAPKTQPQAEPPKTPKIVSRVTQPALAPESPGQQAYYSAVTQAAR